MITYGIDENSGDFFDHIVKGWAQASIQMAGRWSKAYLDSVYGTLECGGNTGMPLTAANGMTSMRVGQPRGKYGH